MLTPAQTWKRCCRFFERKDVGKAVDTLARVERTAHADLLSADDLPLFIVENLATGDDLGVSKGERDIFLNNPFETFAGLHRNLAFAMTGDDEKVFAGYVVDAEIEMLLVGRVDVMQIGRPSGAGLECAVVLKQERLSVIADPGRMPTSADQLDELQATITTMLRVLGTINLPTTTIVERGPKQPMPKKARMPRLGQRPTYILLDRHEVERRWHASYGEGSVMPHWRRGHWRVLKDEKYGNKVGSRVWIRPTRVGEPDVEWREAGVRYVVVA